MSGIDLHSRPQPNPKMFAEHRSKTVEMMLARKQKGILLVYGLPEPTRPHCDFEPVFRQDSCFYWLTGVNEADCALLIDLQTKHETLFYPDIPKENIVWFGELDSIDDLKAKYGFDDVKLMPELKAIVENYIQQKLTIHTLPETFLLHEIETKSDVNKEELLDVVSELRQIKDDEEMKLIQYACDVNCYAIKEAMKQAKPGIFEHQLESILVKNYIDHYCRNVSFNSIVCSGRNCATLHYIKNDKLINDGELILIDAGCEYNCYASDNTRTFPANGKFSKDQKGVYEAVLRCHKYVVDNARPMVYWPDLAYESAKEMCAGLMVIGLLKGGNADTIVDSGALAVFYPHGLGHGMGLDDHDIGGWPRGSKKGDQPHSSFVRYGRLLRPGTVITVEPGCYFVPQLYEKAFEDPVLSKYIDKEVCLRLAQNVGGVRIEDVLYITKDGCKMITDIPRTVEEIERFMAGKKPGEY